MLQNTAVWGLVGTIFTGIVTYLVAKITTTKDLSVKREEYVDGQLKALLELYRTEVTTLKEEIKELIEENKLLREEVLQLKTKIMEMEGMSDGGET